MPRYLYQARSLDGQIQTGQVDANNESEAALRVKAQSLTPLRIVPAIKAAPPSSGMLGGLFEPSVSSKDLQIFTRQFSTLINSGIPVVDALKMLSEGKRDPTLKNAASKVKTAIEAGKRLGDALSMQGNVFDKFYVNMVRAGEEAGILDSILNRLSAYMEKSEKLKKQVKGALFYPAAIIVVAALVIAGILVFIIPKFQELYAASGKELPGLTQIVVMASQFLIKKWYVVLGFAIGIPWAIYSYYKTDEGKDTFDRILIRMPLFGDLIQKSSVAKMTRTLSTLLSSGVGVIEALDIASKTAGNSVIEDALIRSKESVTSGKALATPLSKEPMIPDMVVQMITIGEQSGTLDVMLGKIADFYEDDVENAVKGLTSMIEPILMVFLGGTIAFLVVAMYLPIFDMASIAG